MRVWQKRLLAVTMCAGIHGLCGSVVDAEEPTTASSMPQMAVYRWGAPKGPAQVTAFAEWIGNPDIWGEDFEAPETWDNIQSPGWQLGPWQAWVAANPKRRLILSVPMLPGAWDRSGPPRGIAAKQKVSLEAGAKGDYNGYFKTLAEQLVQRKLDSTILRIGWEMNGGWYTHRASDNPKAWAEYFRQIVKTMRGVPGGDKLQFCWNPATDYLQFPAEQCYPGDEFVDIIGVDVYDQSWQPNTYPIPKDATKDQTLERQKRAWDNMTWGGNHGFKFWLDFGRQHNKPMAICEWGICNRGDGHGGMDDPFFIQQMYNVITDPANKIMFQCYFDVQAGDGHHQLSPGAGAPAMPEFPKSTELFMKLFGKLRN